MARRHHYNRRSKPEHELDVTTFLNLMVVLVPFLLITAVFSRLTIVELNLPSTSGGPSQHEEGFQPEIIVRDDLIQITNGRSVIATIPNKDGEPDLQKLSDFMVELKRTYPDQDAASVLMEARLPYDYLIQVMDIVRSVEVPTVGENGEEEFEVYSLFSDISVGDAP